MATSRFRLLVHGTDRPGIVAGVSSVLTEAGANIVSLDQYSTSADGGQFFQRTVFEGAPDVDLHGYTQYLASAMESLGLSWKLRDVQQRLRVAILASTSDHCLLDLLWRYRRSEIPMTVPMVISNHNRVAEDVRSFGIPFVHVPSQGEDKSAAEQEIVRLLKDNVDLVVLARYMQILSPQFLADIGVPVINIHHSFLPAFIGAGPYRKAKERGVKLIGATAHYVTEELDEGPIIEQGVVRVTHAEDVAALQRKGALVEREVLSRAVLAHCEDRVIRHGRETIVF